ncbi:substrate-binding domain-containing protein [Desulfobacter sp.]|uniref:substrate-binding domain-containing protein n=1 Tax=Desulfobacter sp. TaxID=2294 RepID=UPI001B76FFE9|nr:substrate-binding domain-containing protein [Desulfobacter sp.]MBP9598372.1 substrate-binding domain-containing protein [Desulfobacter sp.]
MKMKKLHRLVILSSIFFCAAISLIPSIVIADNDHTIALVMKALTNPFFLKMEQGAKNFAKENEIPLEVFGIINETDTFHQISIMESLISRNIGAIVLAPADSKKLVPVCKKAIKKGITVINIDNPLDNNLLSKEGLNIPFVGSNNQTGGELLGQYIKQQLKGEGRVIVIEGIRGVENAELRKSGFVKAVTKNSSIWIVASESANWKTEEAFSVTMKLLQKHPSIDAIFCANDKMALGTLQAIDILDLNKKILIAGYDNIESVRNEIRHKKIHATMEQHPELMGAYGVMLAQKKINGEAVPDNLSTPLDIITYETFGKKVAFSISDMKNPFFVSMADGAQKAAELYGIELIINSAENSDSKQLMDLAQFQKSHPDIIILNPTNAESVVPGVEMAVMNKIPVITVDRKSAGGKILCHVGPDNFEGGRMAARLLADILKEKGNIVEIEGIPGTSSSHDRGYGFNDELKKFDNIKIIAREAANFDREQAKQVMSKLLRENVYFDAVFAHNDNMILGVADALSERKLSQNKILVGFDAMREAVQAVKTKKITATIAQHPQKMGRMALEITAKYFRGEEIPSNIPLTLSVIKK